MCFKDVETIPAVASPTSTPYHRSASLQDSQICHSLSNGHVFKRDVGASQYYELGHVYNWLASGYSRQLV